jgi:hypothetical protein
VAEGGIGEPAGSQAARSATVRRHSGRWRLVGTTAGGAPGSLRPGTGERAAPARGAPPPPPLGVGHPKREHGPEDDQGDPGSMSVGHGISVGRRAGRRSAPPAGAPGGRPAARAPLGPHRPAPALTGGTPGLDPTCPAGTASGAPGRGGGTAGSARLSVS